MDQLVTVEQVQVDMPVILVTQREQVAVAIPVGGKRYELNQVGEAFGEGLVQRLDRVVTMGGRHERVDTARVELFAFFAQITAVVLPIEAQERLGQLVVEQGREAREFTVAQGCAGVDEFQQRAPFLDVGI